MHVCRCCMSRGWMFFRLWIHPGWTCVSASTLPLMSVEPPICSHVLCISGSLMWGGYVTMGASHGWTSWWCLGARSCIMIMTIVISIAVWMARYLVNFFGTNGFNACSHCSFGLCYVPVFRPAPFRDIPLCRVRVVNQKLCPGCRLSVLRCRI